MASESGCPIEVHKIEIEKCDETYDPQCQGNKYIPFHRAAYDSETGQSPNNPRQQVNKDVITGVDYGPSVEFSGQSSSMRYSNTVL